MDVGGTNWQRQEVSVMSEQFAANRYRGTRREKLNGGGSRIGGPDGSLAPKADAKAKANSPDDAIGPAWLRRRRAQAHNDLNSLVATVLSHELRNSLSTIRMATGILRMEPSASAAVEKARTLIEHQTSHMWRLAEDLLDASRAHTGHLALKMQTVDLCAVTAQALQSVEFTMQQSNHCMTVAVPTGPLWLQGDPARLEQVLVNLLVNAAKYTPSGGSIRLSVAQVEGEAVLRVCDSGIGIAPDILPGVFDLFVRADPACCHGVAGSGIGLALVRNLVERHGGRVTAASPGLGHG